MIQKEKYGFWVKLAVVSIIAIQYTVTITSPILGTITNIYPEHAGMVKLLETIPTFAAVIISLLIDPLMKYFYKKQLLLFGTALSFVQFIPAVVPGFWPLFICRSIAGFGIGFMFSFAASFAVDMFDEKEAGNLLGLRSTVGAVMGIIYQQLSGRLADATGSYQRSFMICLVLIPIFLLILFKMPKSSPVEDYNREMARKPKEEKPKEKRIQPLTMAFLLTEFVTLLFAYSFMTNVAIICATPTAEGGMGADAATAANILSMFTIAIALSGLLYPRVWIPLFKHMTTGVGVALMMLGLGLNYLSIGMQNMLMIYAGTLVFGFGFEMNNSHLCQVLPQTSVPSAASFLLGLMYAFINLGSFLAGIVTPAVSGAIFGANVKSDWMLSIPGLAVCAVVMLALCVVQHKKTKDNPQTV